MCVEVSKLFPDLRDHLHLLNEHGIEIFDVVLDVRAALVNVADQAHLGLFNVDDFVDMLFVHFDKVFLFCQDHSDQAVVILVDLVQVLAILVLHFFHAWNSGHISNLFEQQDVGKLVNIAQLLKTDWFDALADELLGVLYQIRQIVGLRCPVMSCVGSVILIQSLLEAWLLLHILRSVSANSHTDFLLALILVKIYTSSAWLELRLLSFKILLVGIQSHFW